MKAFNCQTILMASQRVEYMNLNTVTDSLPAPGQIICKLPIARHASTMKARVHLQGMPSDTLAKQQQRSAEAAMMAVIFRALEGSIKPRLVMLISSYIYLRVCVPT